MTIKKTKNTLARFQPKRAESNPDPETQFWNQVAEKSESLIANLIEKVLINGVVQ